MRTMSRVARWELSPRLQGRQRCTSILHEHHEVASEEADCLGVHAQQLQCIGVAHQEGHGELQALLSCTTVHVSPLIMHVEEKRYPFYITMLR